MVIKRSSFMLVLAGSLLSLGAATALAESSAQDEHRQEMEEQAATSQPGEGMMDQTNEALLEGSAAATEKRQEMLEGSSDPGNAEGKMDGYNAELLEGSAAATEKRQEMMKEQE